MKLYPRYGKFFKNDRLIGRQEAFINMGLYDVHNIVADSFRGKPYRIRNQTTFAMDVISSNILNTPTPIRGKRK